MRGNLYICSPSSLSQSLQVFALVSTSRKKIDVKVTQFFEDQNYQRIVKNVEGQICKNSESQISKILCGICVSVIVLEDISKNLSYGHIDKNEYV